MLCQFLLTRLMRGVTSFIANSIFFSVFLLTRLMRGVTEISAVIVVHCGISTHTPHARRDLKETWITPPDEPISTHTPHARRDMKGLSDYNNIPISTHTPHARRDDTIQPQPNTVFLFLLTRLMRGVTSSSNSSSKPVIYFYSHASCEA